MPVFIQTSGYAFNISNVAEIRSHRPDSGQGWISLRFLGEDTCRHHDGEEARQIADAIVNALGEKSLRFHSANFKTTKNTEGDSK